MLKAKPDTTKVLTRISGNIYDLSDFVDSHPGGEQAIKSMNNRDSTLPFLHTHGRDKNVKMLLRKYEVKDTTLLKDAEQCIPKIARVDERFVELHNKYDGGTTEVNLYYHLWLPIVVAAAGIYLVMSSDEWSQFWWVGVVIWAYAIFRTLDLSHTLSHNAIFEDPQKNRWYNEYVSMAIMGFNGRLAFRLHPEHHMSPNILGYDHALKVPGVIWRKDALSDKELQSLIDLPRGPIFVLGSLIGFAWSTLISSSQGLWTGVRQNRLQFCICWAIRTALIHLLVGPTAMAISYMIPMALAAAEATTQHFDQPVMLVEEYQKSKMSFVELQLRSVVGYHASSGPMKYLTVAVDHAYHHLIPTIPDCEITQAIKDEIDQILKEELGVATVSRSLGTALVDAYKQHFGLTETGSNPGYRKSLSCYKARPRLVSSMHSLTNFRASSLRASTLRDSISVAPSEFQTSFDNRSSLLKNMFQKAKKE